MRLPFLPSAVIALGLLATPVRAVSPAEPTGSVNETSRRQVPAPTTTPAEALAELTNYSAAGVSKRLGPVGNPQQSFPTLFQPESKPGTKGLGGRAWQLAGPETEESGDFASTDAQVLKVSDVPYNYSNSPTEGVGVDNVRIYEMSNGAMREAPYPPWNARYQPDIMADDWTGSSGMKDKLGFPVAAARGHGRDANCGLIAFSSGYLGTAGTATARSPWAGLRLPAHKKILSLAVTSQNEFALVGVYDTNAKKGQLCVISLWGGYPEGNTDGPWALLYSNWRHPYPGAPSVGQFTGMKVLGYVELPFRFPTAISAVGEPAQGRVEDRTGNAGALGAFDLNLQPDRDFFGKGIEKNTRVFSRWAEAVVIAKYENQAAHVDLTALFAKMRTAYTTNQAEFDHTKPLHANPWWNAFSQADQDWPQGFASDPSIAPVVTTSIAVDRPTAVLVSEHGDAQVAIASEDGTLQFFSRGLKAPTGSIPVGANPTCLTYEKYNFGLRSGGFLVVSRAARELAWVSKWGPGATVTKRLHDSRLVDPVYAEVSDTHGVEVGLVTVCDFTGKKIVNYRYTDLYLATSTGQRIPLSPAGASFECGGSLAITGNPFALSGSNTN